MAQDWLARPLPLRGKRIWIAGHTGLVGGALLRRLSQEGCDLITAPKAVLDLRNAAAAHDFTAQHKPDMAIIAAARVGGIVANRDAPVDFFQDNLLIAANALSACFKAGVRRVIFLGSSCIYPRDAAQPMAEEALLTGALEPSNEAYAIAKIAGLKLCAAYRAQYDADFFAAMPCNLYGPGDRFDAKASHVIPALMLRMHEAKRAQQKTFTVWGSGMPLREFMYADDLADGLVFMLQHYVGIGPLNIGSGAEISIADLAQMMAEITGYQGEIVFDRSQPDGAPRKLLDCARLRQSGWASRTPLQQGLEQTYAWFLAQHNQGLPYAA
jgi:GDP-L-fucose synthase